MSVVTYEQRRIRTLRSTWWILVISVLAAGGFAALSAAFANVDPSTGLRVGVGPLTSVLSATTNPVVLVTISVMAALAFGGEYRFGLIRLTLTSFPQRTKVFFAKAWVVSLWTVFFLLLALAATLTVAWFFRANVNFDPLTASNIWFAVRTIGVGLGYALLAFSLTLLIRNQAVAIVILLVWSFIVESLLVGILGSRFEWLPKILPMTSGAQFAQGEDMLRNGLVFAAVIVVVSFLAWLLYIRRDA